VANNESDTVSVLLGNGDGTFQVAQNYAVGHFPSSVAVGDFNGDGHLDLVVSDHGDSLGNGKGVSVLLSNGDGTFQAAQTFSTGNTPSYAWLGDFKVAVGDF